MVEISILSALLVLVAVLLWRTILIAREVRKSIDVTKDLLAAIKGRGVLNDSVESDTLRVVKELPAKIVEEIKKS